MSLAIKYLTLFLFFLFLVESATAKYFPAGLYGDIVVGEGRRILGPDYTSRVRYFGMFTNIAKEYQQDADEKYPLWNSTNHLDRSLFLLEKIQNFVQVWDERRKSQITGDPYGDLRNNVQGDLWPIHYDYCRHQSEGTNLLTYLMYDFCYQSERANILKYITYGLRPSNNVQKLTWYMFHLTINNEILNSSSLLFYTPNHDKLLNLMATLDICDRDNWSSVRLSPRSSATTWRYCRIGRVPINI